MPIPFALVCDLLEESHSQCVARKSNIQAVTKWFARCRSRINAPDTNLAALLSTLLPEKRTDRVYCIQANALEKIIARALMLGSSRLQELIAYKQPGFGSDLAECVERILNATPNPTLPERLQVTVEEIDETLHGVASKIKWSSPSVRASQAAMSQRGRSDLESFYRRLTAREAKWFTRLVLKDYQPLIFDSHLIFKSCDPILPFILQIQDDFAVAIKTMQQSKSKIQSLRPRTALSDRRVLATIKPQVSVKIGRQQWFKARSIKHCLDLVHGSMSVETKLDGEYCQIHVTINQGRGSIQIFSKSGKDSTEDRHQLHGIITESLKIGKPESNLHANCILEGELLVYSELEETILPFHHIRKHIARRGRFMNIDQDSASYEHLMIVYYDILFLDNRSLLNLRHSERFKLLEKTVHCEKGQAELVQREIINVNHPLAASALRKAFANVIVKKYEGLVLKPDQPYFHFDDEEKPFSGRCIKFKKEYIGHFGDIGDFAVVGAGFNPVKAKSYDIEGLKWTNFYVGCLENREEVKRWNAKPVFTVVNSVELNESLLKTFISYANPLPIPVDKNTETSLIIAPGVQTTTPMTVAFTNPPVFDMRCFSFDKAGNTGFWSLRFPSVSKIHFDRDFSDAVSFDELQQMAEEATTAPELEDSQENLAWIAKLEHADPMGIGVDAATQLTATTMPTPSPRPPSQITGGYTTPMRSFGKHLPLDASTSQSQGDLAPHQSAAASFAPSGATASSQGDYPESNLGKRGSAPPATFSPQKRRKSSMKAAAFSPSLNRKTRPQDRRPLVDIDANSSQHTPTPCSSFVGHIEWPGWHTADQAANLMAENGTPRITKSSQDVASSSQQSKGFNRSIIVISDSEDNSQETIPSSPPVQEQARASKAGEVTTSDALCETPCPSVCRYAGLQCQLSTRLILLPSYLSSCSVEINALFEDHGLSNIIRGAEDWLERNIANPPSPHSTTESSKMMFVDTVDMAVETKAFLARIEEARQYLPEETRDWISVYDWRVLKHLTVYEDKGMTKKYYDGFQDPWRRWYCGLV